MNKIKSIKDKIAIVSIILAVFLFLLLSKTITSGYHFVDDHEVIKIKNDLKSSSLLNITKIWVKQDLNSNARFRPVYYIHRVFETKLLGSDFILWSLYNAVLCCLALIALYSGMRNLKFGVGESIVFLIITFIGPQSSVWWRLGPGEGLGMVFLGLSFYFMSKSPDKKNYNVNNLLFISFLILSSLTKESFLIIIPGMIYFKIWHEKITIWSSLKESVYKNILLVAPLLMLVIELIIIKFYVGTDYSGMNAKSDENITNILFTGLYFVKTYLNLFIIFIVLLITSWLLKKRVIAYNLFPAAFFLLILIPNIILYAKSGLVERYLLPSSMGLAFLLVSFIKSIGENPAWFKKVALTLVIIPFLPFLAASFDEALKFSQEGEATNKLLSAISTSYSGGTSAMVIADPVESYENSVSLKTYLYYENKIDLYGYAFVKDKNSADSKGYIDGWRSYFDRKQFEDMTSEPGLLIFFDKQMIEDFFTKSKLPRHNYLLVDIGTSTFALLKENQ